MKNKTPSPDRRLSRRKALVIAGVSFVLLIALVFGGIALWFAGHSERVVLRYEQTAVTDGMFRYMTSYYQYELAAALAQSGTPLGSTPAFWDSDSLSPGQSNRAYVGEQVLSLIRQTLVAAALYDRAGFAASALSAVIESQLAADTEEFGGGSTDAFSDYLTDRYGADYEDYRRVTVMQCKASALRSVFDGRGLAGDYAERYYTDNYMRCKVIFYKTAEGGGDLDEGALRNLGYLQALAATSVPVSESDFEARRGSGEQSEAYAYQNYYLRRDAADRLSRTVRGLGEAGGVGFYYDEANGGYLVVARFPLDEKAYEKSENAEFFDGFYATAAILSLVPDVERADEEALAAYDPATCPAYLPVAP